MLAELDSFMSEEKVVECYCSHFFPVLVTVGLNEGELIENRTSELQRLRRITKGNLFVTEMASCSSKSFPFPSGHTAGPHCLAPHQPCHLLMAMTDFHRQENVSRSDYVLLPALEGSIGHCLLGDWGGGGDLGVWRMGLCLVRSEILWTQEGGLDAQ